LGTAVEAYLLQSHVAEVAIVWLCLNRAAGDDKPPAGFHHLPGVALRHRPAGGATGSIRISTVMTSAPSGTLPRAA